MTLRCDEQQTGNGTVALPSKCPDGTCDGCVYVFLWTSQFACARCHEADFTEVVEECSGGKQKVVRIKPKYSIPHMISYHLILYRDLESLFFVGLGLWG